MQIASMIGYLIPIHSAKKGYKRPLLNWTLVASWKTEQNAEKAI
jgi:hypothetical protein